MSWPLISERHIGQLGILGVLSNISRRHVVWKIWQHSSLKFVLMIFDSCDGSKLSQQTAHSLASSILFAWRLPQTRLPASGPPSVHHTECMVGSSELSKSIMSLIREFLVENSFISLRLYIRWQLNVSLLRAVYQPHFLASGRLIKNSMNSRIVILQSGISILTWGWDIFLIKTALQVRSVSDLVFNSDIQKVCERLCIKDYVLKNTKFLTRLAKKAVVEKWRI